MDLLTNILLLIVIAMIAAYFVRENALRKEQLEINKDQTQTNKELAKAIAELAKIVEKFIKT